MTDKLVFRLTPEAQAAGLQLPTKAYANDAAWDFPELQTNVHYSSSMKIECAVISTGIIADIPAGWYGQLAMRSGYADRFHVSGGVIDSGYSGEIIGFVVPIGNVWAVPRTSMLQLLILPIYTLPAYDADGNVIAPRKAGVRGDNGFGSTNDV